MREMSNIINNATSKSLVLVDELGRGTSNYDGVGIAFACAEYLISLSSLTIFTTHYYELHQLATLYPKANNFHLKVEEVGEKLRYLYKVEKGSSPSNSYGLYAAESAGFPKEVIESAREVKALLHRKNPSTPSVEVQEMTSSKMLLSLGTSIKNLVHSTLDEQGMRALLANIKSKVLAYKKSVVPKLTPQTSKMPSSQRSMAKDYEEDLFQAARRLPSSL